MTREPRQGVEYLPGQGDLPGCERAESNDPSRSANAPLRSVKSQKALDFGLFAERGQIDLEDLI